MDSLKNFLRDHNRTRRAGELMSDVIYPTTESICSILPFPKTLHRGLAYLKDTTDYILENPYAELQRELQVAQETKDRLDAKLMLQRNEYGNLRRIIEQHEHSPTAVSQHGFTSSGNDIQPTMDSTSPQSVESDMVIIDLQNRLRQLQTDLTQTRLDLSVARTDNDRLRADLLDYQSQGLPIREDEFQKINTVFPAVHDSHEKEFNNIGIPTPNSLRSHQQMPHVPEDHMIASMDDKDPDVTDTTPLKQSDLENAKNIKAETIPKDHDTRGSDMSTLINADNAQETLEAGNNETEIENLADALTQPTLGTEAMLAHVNHDENGIDVMDEGSGSESFSGRSASPQPPVQLVVDGGDISKKEGDVLAQETIETRENGETPNNEVQRTNTIIMPQRLPSEAESLPGHHRGKSSDSLNGHDHKLSKRKKYLSGLFMSHPDENGKSHDKRPRVTSTPSRIRPASKDSTSPMDSGTEKDHEGFESATPPHLKDLHRHSRFETYVVRPVERQASSIYRKGKDLFRHDSDHHHRHHEDHETKE